MLIYCCLGNLLRLVIIFSINDTGWYRSVTPQVMLTLRLDNLIFEGGWWVILKQNILSAYQEPMVDSWAYLHSNCFSKACCTEKKISCTQTSRERNSYHKLRVANTSCPYQITRYPSKAKWYPPPPEPNSSRKIGRSNYFQLYFLQTQANLYWTYLVLLFEVATISFHGIIRFNK